MPSISECRVPYLLSNLDLGDRVVDVDRRERQFACGGELVQPQHAGGGLLGDALDRLGDLGPLGLVGLEALADAAPGTPCTRRSRRPRSGGTTPAFSNCAPRSTSMVASPPSSRIMLAGSSGQVSICSAAHQYSSRVSPFHANTGTPLGSSGGAVRADDDRGGGMVLGGEDVARRPADLGAERDQRLDQHRGLHRHVQRAGDARALQRQHVGVLAAQRHQARHLVLGQPDLLAAELGQGQVGHLVIDAVANIGGQPLLSRRHGRPSSRAQLVSLVNISPRGLVLPSRG